MFVRRIHGVFRDWKNPISIWHLRMRTTKILDLTQINYEALIKFDIGTEKFPKVHMCRCQTVTSNRAIQVPQNNSRKTIAADDHPRNKCSQKECKGQLTRSNNYANSKKLVQWRESTFLRAETMPVHVKQVDPKTRTCESRIALRWFYFWKGWK